MSPRFSTLRRRLSKSSGVYLPSCVLPLLARPSASRQTALALAEVDVLGCLAHIAALRNYCRPHFDEAEKNEDVGDLEIVEGRHPVIELQETGGGERAFRS